VVSEFKQFIARGNVIDLAVGVIMGGAFGSIVTSLVNDVIMPPIGSVLKGVNFSDLFFSLDQKTYPSLKAAKDAGAPVIGYGSFINALISFLIVAFVVFLIVQQVNKLYRKPAAPPPPPEPPADVVLLTEIRDLLKSR
jgi:large conductance mechanosensitive channel